MIEIKEIIDINKKFDKGDIVNQSSLDFAISYSKASKDWIKQLAYITRALIIDHVFKEGNKRTASALIMSILEKKKIAYDPRKVDEIIIEIIKKNVININKIRSLIKDVTR